MRRGQFHILVLCMWVGLIAQTSSISRAAADSSDVTKRPLISPMFGDHMVLQRGKPNTFWGWVKPGEHVKVSIGDHSAGAVADTDGRWQAKIDPPSDVGPYDVTIDGPEKVQLHDVLVGDVWLCGGQSNMELGLPKVSNAAAEIKASDQPQVRLFEVHQQVSYSSADVPVGKWEICSPQSVAEGAGFSAVGYFFGTILNKRL